MSIKAIETRYAGCRFRSRQEARYAVFFDTLGIAWEYEPQGFEIEWRLSLRPGTFRYLPDFWLPGHQLWVEVKGSLTAPECERVLNAAAYLSTNGGGGCHDAGGHDLVLAGPISRLANIYDVIHIPWQLHMHKGDLIAGTWLDHYGTGINSIYIEMGAPDLCPVHHDKPVHVAADYGGSLEEITKGSPWPPYLIPDRLLAGYPVPSRGPLAAAITAARSARFEHGERG